MNAYLVILLVLGIKSQALANATFKEEDCYPLLTDDEYNRMVLSPPWELSPLDIYKRRCYVYFKERIPERQKGSLISSTTEDLITTLITENSKLESNTIKDNVISSNAEDAITTPPHTPSSILIPMTTTDNFILSAADVPITTPYAHTPSPTLIPMTTTKNSISSTADVPITTPNVHTPSPELSPVTTTENFISNTADDPIKTPHVHTPIPKLISMTTTDNFILSTAEDPITSPDVYTSSSTLGLNTKIKNIITTSVKVLMTKTDVYMPSSTLNQITTTEKYTLDPTTSSDIFTGIITTDLISNAAEELQDTTLKGTLHLTLALCVIAGIIVIVMVAKLIHTRMRSGTHVLKADPV